MRSSSPTSTRLWRSAGRCSTKWSVTVLGRCWRRRCRPRSPPMSTPTSTRSTRPGRRRSAMATTGPWEVATAAGAVPARAPGADVERTDQATGERRRFASATSPAWARESPQVAEVLPLLYQKRWSSSWAPPRACRPRRSPGSRRSGKTRPRRSTSARSPSPDHVYCWVDGIHLKVRLDQDKVCLLVILGVRADGTKELVALADGFASRPSRGPTCSAAASGVGWPPRCWRSATAHSGSGRRSARCSPRPGNSVAGSTSRQCSVRAAQVGAPRREGGARGDL